jgi:tetratricopeptide (TPR) repeat protein
MMGASGGSTQRRRVRGEDAGNFFACLGVLRASALKWASRLAGFAAVAALAVTAYLNILGNEFVYDDGAQILRNYYIRDTSHLRAIFTTNVWSFLGPHAVSNYYRPVMHLVYMADYALFGYQPAGYHAASILFHALNAVLVLLVAEAIGLAPAVAMLGAALFAVHPITTESVAWAAGIPELTYAFFFLLSIWLYARARPPASAGAGQAGAQPAAPLLAASVAAALAALFSKETGLMLAPAIILYEHLLRKSPEPHPARMPFYAGHVAATGFYLAMRIHSLGGFQVATNPYGVMAPGQFALSAIYLAGKYVGKLFAPAPFNIFHVFHPARGLGDLRVLGGLAILAAAAAAAWLLWKRSQPLAFALAIIFLPLLPVLDVRAIGHNIFTERYLYLPAAGFCLLLAAALARLGRRHFLTACALAALLALNYGLLTRFRNADWHDNVLLYTATLQVSPESNLIRDNLGKTFLDGFGRPDLALELFRECARRAPERHEYHLDMGLALGELRRYDEALRALDRSLETWPRYPEAFLARGDVYRELGRPDEARQQYQRALEIKPFYAEALAAMGWLEAEQGRDAQAEQHFLRALAVTDLVDANLGLGELSLRRGRPADAERAFRQVLVSEPHSVAAWLGLGKSLRSQGRAGEAATCFARALNERKFAHQRRLGRPPLPDPEAIRREM